MYTTRSYKYRIM